MHGRFAKEWAEHDRTQPGKKSKLTSWTMEVIDFIFTQWWTLWESRNQDRHGRDLATQQQADTQQMHQELTQLYNDYANQTPQHMQWLFNTPIEVQRQCNLSHQAMV